ncbi:MAG TPA: hypothetical protein DHN33_08860 [Eubacteriaceae bacterium]|nr:hypothetical protein [Eubacteriaceae bacterium]
MKRNQILLIILVVIIGIAAAFAFLSDADSPAPDSTETEQNNTEAESEENEEAEDDSQSESEEAELLKAPNFTLEHRNGESVSLEDYQGKKVFLNFWATWCGPCEIEMPYMEQIHLDYEDENLVILAVNVGENPSTVRQYVEENGYSFDVLFDVETEVAKTYGVSGIPATFFIDEEGYLRGRHVGTMDYEMMENYIQQLP